MTPLGPKYSGDAKSSWDDLLTSLPKPPPPPSLIDEKFKAQADYLQDLSSLIVVLCTRRAGKSYGAALRLLRAAHLQAGASCLYIALTRDSAKRILWKDVLKAINREMRFGAVFNETTLSMTLVNGSVIYLLGADTDEQEKEKLLGQKYAAVVIDESASFSIDLEELVYGVLKPAVADYRGTISLIGTPGNLKRGLYFDLTSGQNPLEAGRWSTAGWSGHRWSAADNPHMREKWLAEIAELKAARPGIEDTPIFQQNYYGRWVIDDTKLVYRYSDARNSFTELPKYSRGEWRYVLGCDLGHEDATAWVVSAYHEHSKTLYILEASKEKGLDITAVARRTEALRRAYVFDVLVIDGANKQAVVEMQNRHQIPWVCADKAGKEDFIEIMNGDFLTGHIKLGPGAAPLADEYRALVWDEKKLKKTGERKEHSACDNHATDAALYGWRHCYSYLNETPPAPLPPEDEMEKIALEQFERGRNEERQTVGDSSNWEAGWR